MEKKFEIYNEEGQKIVGLVDSPESSEKSAVPIILCHGFKGYATQPLLKIGTEYLVSRGYTVFRFDATNGIGESGGDIYNCTVTHYVDDLLCVIDYVSKIPNLNLDKLTVFGTSMGGLVAVIAASKDPRIKIIATHSASFDPNLIRDHPDLIHPTKDNEDLEFVSKGKGLVIKVNYELVNDGLKYDAFSLIRGLDIPMLFLHSGKDEGISVEHSKRAFNVSLSKNKKLVVISEATHFPTDKPTIESIFSEVVLFTSLSKKEKTPDRPD